MKKYIVIMKIGGYKVEFYIPSETPELAIEIAKELLKDSEAKVADKINVADELTGYFVRPFHQ